MPEQHTCHACGHDLSRIRGVLDPALHLAVVVCPGCATPTARRSDPVVEGYRRALRTARAGISVVLQCFVVLALTGLAVSLIGKAAMHSYREFGRNPLAVLILEPGLLRPDAHGPELLVLTGMLLLVGIFAGVWARSALRHLPGIAVWSVWAIAVIVLATAPGWLSIGSGSLPKPPRPRWGDPMAARALSEILTMGVLFALFVLMGLPLGRTVHGLWVSGAQARRGAYRRKRRRIRENR